MSTTVVRPNDPTLHAAFRLALAFAGVKLLLHIVTNLLQPHLGYGFFRDELYYLVCGRRLAWGYVDHGPLVAVQARAAELFFGHSLAGIRMFSAIAGAARTGITGLLAWSLGGRRPAQALAMIGVLASPQYLSIDSFLSMNSAESLFWMTCLLALIFTLRGGDERWWLLFGLSAGLGLLNKPSMSFFLIALLAALILTQQRRLLAERSAVVGTALLLLIATPYMLWQVHHHWPTLEFLLNARHSHKNPRLPPLTFLGIQILYMEPLTIFIWGAGLVSLLRSKANRWIGLTFVFFIAMMIVLHGNHYYAAPIYPILFAAGGIAWERRFANRPRVALNRTLAFPLLEASIIAAALISLPWGIPVLAPDAWLRYMKATHLYAFSINAQGRAENRISLFFAERFGWPQEVEIVTQTWNALSPEDRKLAAIICANYGEASAINYLGKGLPFAISSNNNYFLWGPEGATGELLIAVTPQPPEVLARAYDSVQIVGRMHDPHSLPAEHVNIYLLRGRYKNLTADWPDLKNYY